MGDFKESMELAGNTMNRYLYLHFYFYMLPAIITLLEILDIPLVPSIIMDNDLIAMLIFCFTILFVPSALWFILVKIFKNIHYFIITPFFLLFVVSQIIAIFLSIVFGTGEPIDISFSQPSFEP